MTTYTPPAIPVGRDGRKITVVDTRGADMMLCRDNRSADKWLRREDVESAAAEWAGEPAGSVYAAMLESHDLLIAHRRGERLRGEVSRATERMARCDGHRAVREGEAHGYQGSVSPYNENRAAHGGVTYSEYCACGARRSVNSNNWHREEGPWRVDEEAAQRRAEGP